MSAEYSCACKGIRTCLLCEDRKKNLINYSPSNLIKYTFCATCGDRAWIVTDHSKHNQSEEATDEYSPFITIKGVYVAENSITEAEENQLVNEIDQATWMLSQSGRRKQDYGPKANFKKQKCKIGNFKGLPKYIKSILGDIKQKHSSILGDFIPVELCNLEYEPSRGSAIDPHLDDMWLWGERLVTINYLPTTILTLTKLDLPNVEVLVYMPPRSLLVLYDDARKVWMHSVKREDVMARRLATTLRELTPIFMEGGDEYEPIGKQILQTAANFV